jgi:hypothetical protein
MQPTRLSCVRQGYFQMTSAITLIFLGFIDFLGGEGGVWYGLDTKHYLSLIFMCYCTVQC